MMSHRAMMSRRHRNYTVKAVSEVGKFSSIACNIMSCLAVEIFMQKNSLVTKRCHLALVVPLIMPHRVYIYGFDIQHARKIAAFLRQVCQ